MARLLYSLAWHLALPLVLARLWWRGRKEPGYRQHIAERFGFCAPRPDPGRTVWIHAVSVGETRAAEPLVRGILAAWPDSNILLTHMTPTGRATGRDVFGALSGRVRQCYLPYDLGWACARFLRSHRPVVCVLMETEVWPNLLAQCEAQGVPVALVNARLSERSWRRAERLAVLMRPAARRIRLVAAQTTADAQRIAGLGAQEVQVAGSVKFDVTVPAAMMERAAQLRARMQADAVLLCASTREGEEVLILDAWRRVRPDNVLLVIVPRHPQRFDEVEQMIRQHGFNPRRRSKAESAQAGGDVLVGDSMGEMFAWYGACDLAFIGGSLLPLGGQNLIESFAVGKPVLVGPHTFNFLAITEQAIQAGAALRCATADDMVHQALSVLSAPSTLADMGQQALAFAAAHKGATQRTLALLEPLIAAGGRK